MSPAKNQQQSFPAVPPFLSAGDHETRDYYTEQETSRPHINQAPYLTPYLGLRARLSQVWINRWTVLLLLVLVRTLLAISSIDDNLDSARVKALSACTSVENVGSAMASMPHYLSKGVNELAATGVEKAVGALESMLMLSITAVEELVVFVINMMTSTYVCLITLAVSGSLHAALELISKVKDFLDQNLGPIGDDIGKVVGDFTNELNKFVDGLNSLPFVDNKVPKLDVTDDINKLKDIKLPDSLDGDLQKLNASIPDFKDVNNATMTALRFPFEEIKKLVNESLGPYSFDRSVFPVPQKEALTFCTGSNGINDFFDSLVKLSATAKKVFLAVLVILAVLVCIPMAYREMQRWRTMQKRSQLVTQQASDPLDVVYIASRPYTAGFGIKLASRFRSTRRQHLVRWAVAYATTTPALFVLSLAIAGLFSCFCQWIFLRAVQKEVPALENQVGNFAEKVVTALNGASEKWADGVNGVIKTTNDDINKDVFGWVTKGTSAINDTLNVFVEKMSDGLDTAFGGTILNDPIKEVMNCLIGLKIESIQKGLTWAHDHAHVDFPLLAPDTFSLGAAASLSDSNSMESFLASPGSKSRDEISEAVDSVVRRFQGAIRQEAIIAACLLIIWLIIASVGVVRALMLFLGRDKTRGEGGQNYPADPLSAPQQTRNLRPESSAPPYEYSIGSNSSDRILPCPQESYTRRSNNEKFGTFNASDARQRQSSHAQVAGSTHSSDEKSRTPFA